MCVSANANDVHCYQIVSSNVYATNSTPAVPPTHLSSFPLIRRMNFDTRSHGGGYSAFAKEFWFPQWAGTAVYRYSRAGQYLGSFNTPDDNIMQLWGDSVDASYYMVRSVAQRANPLVRVKGNPEPSQSKSP